MSRIVIQTTEESPQVDFPTLAGVSADGAQTRSVISGDDRSILCWVHELRAGAEIRWEAPPVGHAVYVWFGGIEANGHTYPSGSAVIVEHGGSVAVRGGPEGATLVHYHGKEGHEAPSCAGGHAHALEPRGLLTDVRPAGHAFTLYADSSCPTCEMWLHKSFFEVPRPQAGSHYHTEDEIIFVVEGSMLVGRRVLKPGTALAIDQGTRYGFGVPEEGLKFINFRCSDPSIVAIISKDERLGPTKEREILTGAISFGRVAAE